MVQQLADVACQAVDITHPNEQRATRPRLVQRNLAQVQASQQWLDRCHRQHSNAHPCGHHLTHCIEAAYLDAVLQASPQQLGFRHQPGGQ
ncbi:hypothetical protein FQZ97_1014470 [compost metagenome]